METCYIYVVRHGESVYNRDDVVSGQNNPKLTALGRQQANETKAKLAKIKFDEVYSSDLQRASDTAAIIFGELVPANHLLIGLRERSFGRFEGVPNKKIRAIRNVNLESYSTLSHDERMRHKFHPDIESDYDLAIRFVEALEAIALENPGKTVLVGAHGGTIRTMLIKLGYRTIDQLKNGAMGNAGYVQMSFKDGEFAVQKVEGLQE